ncbi:hypothetical protein GCM10022226_38500 [Sphaerisporangium flaviroseum]|uniref:DUF998 domain-containing protein n=1 Tax=Sphaerisporangium flaviroseum TaxID=509199 RepID=A0ABP7IAZ9_9ACTN
MVQRSVSPEASTRTRPTTPTTGLLACGVVAGPLFLGVWLIQALTRDGFDLTYHPLSLLSLGGLGWIQITSFVVAGLLNVAFAAGLRRVLHTGRGGTWGPLLIALSGVGLVMAGVFTADPGAGFPPGAPIGAPTHISWHGVLHEVGFMVTSVSWIASCYVLARRFAEFAFTMALAVRLLRATARRLP